jgi:hypothetical protein
MCHSKPQGVLSGKLAVRVVLHHLGSQPLGGLSERCDLIASSVAVEFGAKCNVISVRPTASHTLGPAGKPIMKTDYRLSRYGGMARGSASLNRPGFVGGSNS